jgi:hypothetical protein
LIEKIQNIWLRISHWVGYSLFILSIIYGIYKAPDELWRLHLGWMGLAVVSIMIMFCFEIIQFFLFLIHHKIKLDFLIPIRFTLRKSILNSILPAKTGTIIVLNLITSHYKLAWHAYVQFMLIATTVMLLVSGVACLGLLIPELYFVLFLILLCLIAIGAGKFVKWDYGKQMFPLLVVSMALYLCRLFIFWALLRGTGNDIGLYQASYFAIATNTLAQVSITPGNIGVREIIFGLMSPYIFLPMSVGIIIGAIFQVLRIIVYATISLIVDIFFWHPVDKLKKNL